MLSLRDYAGVRDENPYLFATGTGGEGHAQGSKDIDHVVRSISWAWRKWYRDVPTLIPVKYVNSVQQMLSLRDYAGIRDENPYLFATGTGGEGHAQGSKDIDHVVRSISWAWRKWYRDVPTLIPVKYVNSVQQMLSLQDYAGVRDKNPYLFATGTGGEGHAQGSKDIDHVVRSISWAWRKWYRDVPTLIPVKYVNSVQQMLSLRDYTGVRDENPYLFATGTGGEGHAQGSKDIDHVVRSISGFQKPELLTATKIRHKKSSDFAEIEGNHTDEEIELFYKHMGHEKQISKDVYQCPRALRRVQHVGRILESIEEDEGESADMLI